MNEYDKLKLAVYESGLPFEEACDIINALESCSDEELPDAVEATLEILENVDVKALARKGKATIGGAVGKIPAMNKEKVKKTVAAAKKKLAAKANAILSKCNAKSIALTKKTSTLKNKINNAIKKLQKKGVFKEASSDIEATLLTPSVKARVLKLHKLYTEINKLEEEIQALSVESRNRVTAEVEKGNTEIEKAMVMATLVVNNSELYNDSVEKLRNLWTDIEEELEKLNDKLVDLTAEASELLTDILDEVNG